MNENQMFQCNQIIAKFMGWTDDGLRIYITGRSGHMGKIAYNESLDLLMLVIEKIESLPTNKEAGEQYQFNISGDGISITKYDDGSGVISQRANVIGESKLQAVFEVVSDFCCEYFNLDLIK